MDRVDRDLHRALQDKLKIGARRLNELIAEKHRQTALPRRVAAIALALEAGVPITKYAKDEDLAEIRRARNAGYSPVVIESVPQGSTKSRNRKKTIPGVTNTDPFLDEKVLRAAENNAEIYPVFYAFENSVRAMISRVMEKKYGVNWWDNQIGTGMKDRVKKRMDEEKEYLWHSARGLTPIYYTDIKDLRAIISTQNAIFSKLFDITKVTMWIDEIEKTRNVLAHNNPVARKDRERLIVYARDWSELAPRVLELMKII